MEVNFSASKESVVGGEIISTVLDSSYLLFSFSAWLEDLACFLLSPGPPKESRGVAVQLRACGGQHHPAPRVRPMRCCICLGGPGQKRQILNNSDWIFLNDGGRCFLQLLRSGVAVEDVTHSHERLCWLTERSGWCCTNIWEDTNSVLIMLIYAKKFSIESGGITRKMEPSSSKFFCYILLFTASFIKKMSSVLNP